MQSTFVCAPPLSLSAKESACFYLKNNACHGFYPLHEMVEKPDPDHAPSTLAVIGRYVLEPEIFERLKKVQKGVGGEIQLTDAIAGQLNLNTTYSHRFDGIRYDCGSKQGFLDATVRFARKAGYSI